MSYVYYLDISFSILYFLCGNANMTLNHLILYKKDDLAMYSESRDFKALEERLFIFSDRIRFGDDLTFLEARLTNEIKSS